MKLIRLIAAGLLFFMVVMHIYFAITAPSEPLVVSLFLGILYFTLGVLLTLNKRFGIWLGFIIPLIMTAVSPFMVDYKTLDTWSIILLVANVLILLSCLVLLLKKSKG
jgi:hypothetical protein